MYLEWAKSCWAFDGKVWGEIKRFDVTLVRRWADLVDSKRRGRIPSMG